ncbi:MAG: hypothetical protein QHH07_12590, partial [Sedimentisphaerales bacterium]|nr:hypothetical protein [Sedimentisphaerales bacterium]
RLYERWQVCAKDGNCGIDASIAIAIDEGLAGIFQQMAREIGLCLRYYSVAFRGQRIEQVFLAGGGSYNQKFIDAIRSHCNCSILTSPVRRLDRDGGPLGGQWLVALGLASDRIREISQQTVTV